MAWSMSHLAISVRSVLKESTNTRDQIIYRGEASTPPTLNYVYVIPPLNRNITGMSASTTRKKTRTTPNSARCLPSGAKAGIEADEDDLAVDDLTFFSCIRF